MSNETDPLATTQTPTDVETTVDMPELDPVQEHAFLNEDLSGVDTSIPLIKESLQTLTVASIEEAETNDGDGKKLNIKLTLNREAMATTGEMVKAGFPIFHTISLTPTPNYDREAIKRRVAAFVQACGGTKPFPWEQFEGAVVQARVSIQKERKNKETGEIYPARNVIGMFVPKSKVTAG